MHHAGRGKARRPVSTPLVQGVGQAARHGELLTMNPQTPTAQDRQWPVRADLHQVLQARTLPLKRETAGEAADRHAARTRVE